MPGGYMRYLSFEAVAVTYSTRSYRMGVEACCDALDRLRDLHNEAQR
jgi:hypothetical protein